MKLQDLKTSYLARHWMSLDESARSHLSAFVAMVEGAVESAAIAVEHLVGLGYTVTEPGASPPDADPAHVVETVTYSDGITATGTPPLPAVSPAQQAAAEQAPAPDAPALSELGPVASDAAPVESDSTPAAKAAPVVQSESPAVVEPAALGAAPAEAQPVAGEPSDPKV